MQTGSFVNKRGHTIHTVMWEPQRPAKAIILLVHGMREHTGRYQHVADYLTAEGYLIYSHDHQGHGQSQGITGFFDDFLDPVEDVEQHYRQIKAAHPTMPIFVYGHSMGSLISLLFVLEHQHDLIGWICTGSPLHVREIAPDALYAFGRVLARFFPKLFFLPPSLDDVSRNPKITQEFATDPLVYKHPSRIGLIKQIIETGVKVRSRIPSLTLPVLIMHGDADTIAPYAGSQYLYDHVSSSDKQLKIYEGLYHEIHNEPEQDEVLADILAWLEAHCPSTT